ncbi:acetolactate synthase small subunit [Tumebacillus permanentifrigoris]|uniref:Acetolactate synthase small subunit n=1 Tax=Tumebacillus permanentifrigoris TaxID=378543 RepID=A0A316D8F1_9BACL|nr:acetolactate synthase small subunit [Tumebacillus permanentifrigoris]
MKQTLTALVLDQPGVLMRVAGLVTRRGFNIDSLTVGPAEEAGLSRMTITIDTDAWTLEQIIKQLYKLVDVVKVSAPAALRNCSNPGDRPHRGDGAGAQPSVGPLAHLANREN